MSVVISYLTFAYTGSYPWVPVKTLCGTPNNEQARDVYVNINWSDPAYGAPGVVPDSNIGVAINLQSIGVVPPISAIYSIYIDNTGVNFPVSVYFADTAFRVSCGANSTQFYPVVTGQLQAVVVGNATWSDSPPTIAITTFHFLNYNPGPTQSTGLGGRSIGLSYGQASNTGGTSHSLPFATGDLVVSGEISLQSTNTANLYSATGAYSIIVTSYWWYTRALYNSAGAVQINCSLVGKLSGSTVWTVPFTLWAEPDMKEFPYIARGNQSGLNMLLSGNGPLSLILQNTGTCDSGYIGAVLHYTITTQLI